MENKSEWISHPDVCRCCLDNIGLSDLNKGYDSTGPAKEILADLLQDCFGISLSYLSQEGVSRLICDACASKLRYANDFRQQVLVAEQRFSKYINKERGIEELVVAPVIVKVETEIESYGFQNNLESPPPVKAISCESVRVSTDINCKSQRNLSKTKHKKAVKKKKALKAPETSTTQQHIQKRTIQNTELNRLIRLNTSLILKNSTVVPFRNKRNNNGKYTCFYCEVNFFQIREMRKHVNETHDDIGEDEIIKILKIPAVFKLTKAELSQVYCKICRQDLQNLNNLIEHLIDVHKKTFRHVDFKPAHGILGFILESENPTCYECHKEFPFFQALVTHMTGQHSQNFACDKCDKKFLFKTGMVKHLLQCHDEHAAAKIYKCKFCNETFRKSSMKQNHMRKAHGYGKFRCVECGATFMEHSQRVRHVVEVHNYKRPLFKCELCPKVCMSASMLSAHVKTHGDNKLHDCEICGKKVTSRSSLRTHLRIHSGERPYACQFCEKRFKSHGTLTTHERGHMNDKRYVCEICDAAFIQIHCLRRHYTSRHPDCGIDLKSIRAKKND